MGEDVQGWFTGRAPDDGGHRTSGGALGGDGNVAHRRPHVPHELARTRAVIARATATEPDRWHFMEQVHGTRVAVVDEATPPGAELRGADGLVTTLAERPLVVQVADCVPVLLAGPRTVGVLHAGRAGVVAGIVAAGLRETERLGDEVARMRAVMGPAIGGCCYEVPSEMRDQVGQVVPEAPATTSWGTPALDLPRAVAAQLTAVGIGELEQVGSCTRCDPEQRWFSHRADPRSGRQIGLVVRRSAQSGPAA